MSQERALPLGRIQGIPWGTGSFPFVRRVRLALSDKCKHFKQ